eukprot:gene2260-495_t
MDHPGFDLTNPAEHALVFKLGLVNLHTITYPTTLAGIKAALSKLLLRQMDTPSHLTFMFAVYNEHNRLKPSSDHPAGEDFLVQKVQQLRWLYDGCDPAVHSSDILIVDDGCPENSGQACQHVITREGYADFVRVLFLEDAISAKKEPVGNLASTKDSRKGGSVLYGLWEAHSPSPDCKCQGTKQHIVAYTDADLSADLSQSGLLLHALLHGPGNLQPVASIGVICPNIGWIRCTFWFMYQRLVHCHWRRTIIPPLASVIDTQCGFKAFKAKGLRPILRRMADVGNTFDMELLLLACLSNAELPNPISVVPIAWTDSLDESNFVRSHDSFFKMQKRLVQLHNQYNQELPLPVESKAYLAFIDSLTFEAYSFIMDNLHSLAAPYIPSSLLFISFDRQMEKTGTDA